METEVEQPVDAIAPTEEVVDQVAPANTEDLEYKEKAEQLENRLDRMEGRFKKEEMLAAWFEGQDSDVTVRPIQKKGAPFTP